MPEQTRQTFHCLMCGGEIKLTDRAIWPTPILEGDPIHVGPCEVRFNRLMERCATRATPTVEPPPTDIRIEAEDIAIRVLDAEQEFISRATAEHIMRVVNVLYPALCAVDYAARQAERERILDIVREEAPTECDCHPGYKSRDLVDPQCAYCDHVMWIIERIEHPASAPKEETPNEQ